MHDLEIIKENLENIGFVIRKIEDIEHGKQIMFVNSALVVNVYEKSILVQGKTDKEENLEEEKEKLKAIIEEMRKNDKFVSELNKKIVDIIKTKQETATVDFKLIWHEKSQKLVHDIICLANTASSEDGYLIIGVADNGDVTGIKDRAKARKSNDIMDTLEKYKFAGGVRPEVEVRTIHYMTKEVDVLVVKNTNNTPYYLEETVGSIVAQNIYTRYSDKNTSINGTAPYNVVKALWEKNIRNK